MRPSPPLVLVMVMVMLVPLRAAAQHDSSAPLHLRPWGARSVPGHSPRNSDHRQHIIHVPDTYGSGISPGNSFDAREGSNHGDPSGHSFGPVAGTITISGVGGTITITPAGYGTNIDINPRTSAGVGPNTNFGTHTDFGSGAGSGSNSGTEFGPSSHVITSDRNSFVTSTVEGSNPSSDHSFGAGSDYNSGSSFDAGVHPSSDFIEGSNPSSEFIAGSDSFVDASHPSFNPTTGSNRYSDIIGSSVSSGHDSNLNFVSGPEFSSGTSLKVGSDPNAVHSFTNSGSDLLTSFGQTPNPGSGETNPKFSIGSITSSFKQFGTNLNRNVRLGADPRGIIATGGQTGAGAGGSAGSRSATRRPFSSRFGPEFGTKPGHIRRKTCITEVNLTIEYDLRLIPYNIPVVGPEVPESGCARDEIRFGTADGPCIRALDQGTCGENQWILYDNVTNLGQCADRPCPIGSAFVEATGFCHDQFEADFCPGDRLIQVTASGESVCGCDDGWFPDRCGICQLIYSHEGCPSGLAHQFNTDFQFRCLPTPCAANSPVQLPGGLGCSFFGASCTYRENNVTLIGEWGFLTDSLNVSCISSDATVSRRRRDLSSQANEDLSVSELLGRQEEGSQDHSSTRSKRAVFGDAAPVNSCQPGAKTDFNAACRSASGMGSAMPPFSRDPRSGSTSQEPPSYVLKCTHMSKGTINGKWQMCGERRWTGQVSKSRTTVVQF